MGYLFGAVAPAIMGHIGTWKTPAVAHYTIIATAVLAAAVIACSGRFGAPPEVGQG